MTHSFNENRHEGMSNPFTLQQLQWLEEKTIPERLFLKLASEFDDRWLYPSRERWDYRFSGQNVILDFNKSIHLKTLTSPHIKLIKIILIYYASEHVASKLYDIFRSLALAMKELTFFTHDNFIDLLNKFSLKKNNIEVFFACLYACRKLDAVGFFSSTDGDKEIEDRLLFIPRPAKDNFNIYSDIDNILPPSTISMIENGLQELATKLAPRLNSPEEKQKHLEKIKKSLSLDKLQDCIILGLCFITGARPVQLSKLAVGDIFIDAESNSITRFALQLPYAKKNKVTVERIAVSLPDELGKLIFLYITLAGLTKGEPLLPQDENAEKLINRSLARQLLRFSSLEMQEAVKAGFAEAPIYTSSSFRHNVGHFMAMAGASAEEIAYMLGHTSTVVAGHYISSTPSLAEIRENALGTNPVFQSMIALMMTGNLTSSQKWQGRKVAGNVGDKLHYHIGGCNYTAPLCPFSQVRACYGCLYFMPFIDGKHHEVFDAFNDEIVGLLKLSLDTNENHHPLIPELTRRKQHIMMVITRIKLFNQRQGIIHE